MQAYKVKLYHPASNTSVIFDAAPDISESGAVVYRSVEPIHAPGGINVYTNTASRTFTLSNIKLFSRTQSEATRNYNRFQMLRSWRYPSFGATPEHDEVYGWQRLGAPPATLELSAYSQPSANGVSQANGLIYRIPVVIASINLNYPTDCDYIPTVQLDDLDLRHIPTGIPFPTIMPLDMTLTESHTPNQYAKFSLTDFKRGTMVGF